MVKPFHESDFSMFQSHLKGEGFPEFKRLPKNVTGTNHKPYKIIEQWLLPRSDMAQSRIFYVIQRFNTKKGKRIRVAYYKNQEEGKSKGRWLFRRSGPWYTPEALKEILPLLKKLRYK